MTKVTKPLAGDITKPTPYELAELCRLAYADRIEAFSAYESLGYKVKCFNKGEFYILSNNVVVFRGSDSIRDWAHNILAVKTPGGRHLGFWRRFCSYNIASLVNKDTIFTGHSLGGAMAVYAASQFDATAITFGEPMNADSDIMRGLTHIRYVNNMDIVPKLPPVGYIHSGELRYLDYYGKLHVNPNRWRIIKDRILSRFKAFIKAQKFDDFYDHWIEEYINKLK